MYDKPTDNVCERCSWAEMNNDELERIIADYGIVKNRKKVYSVRQNALAVIQIQKKYGSFSSYVWAYTENHIGKGIKDTG
ncbi:MAG: DNA-3-methyladenine glycosylase I [Megasphaera sp.]|nr:DNA-3-methyladenine glycosylase I [Megasphaera sp.]